MTSGNRVTTSISKVGRADGRTGGTLASVITRSFGDPCLPLPPFTLSAFPTVRLSACPSVQQTLRRCHDQPPSVAIHFPHKFFLVRQQELAFGTLDLDHQPGGQLIHRGDQAERRLIRKA